MASREAVYNFGMTHYVCGGNCGGEGSRPGVCQAEGCSHEDQPLVECNCEDGIHRDVAPTHTHEGEYAIDSDLDE